jgi:hypothetical protein
MTPEWPPPGRGTLTGSACSADMAEHVHTQVVRFPLERIARAAVGNASKMQIWKGRMREWLGWMLNRANAPGAIRAASFKDSMTGQEVEISVGELFVRLTVNGRDYYFDRLTGKLDGTGSAL